MRTTKRTWVFLAIVFGLSWALCAIAYAGGIRLSSPLFSSLGMAMMLCPLAAAAICAAIFPETGPDGKKIPYGKTFVAATGLNFRIGWKGFFLSWLVFPAAIIASIAINLLFPGVRLDLSSASYISSIVASMPPEQAEQVRKALEALPLPLALLQVPQALAAGVSVNALFAFGEEAGWRGYLARSMKGSGFWAASLFIGAVWGIWHAPLIVQGYNYPQHPVQGVFMMVVFCVLVGAIQLYLRMRMKSTVAAAVAHGTLNGFAGMGLILLSGGSDLTKGFLGAAGFIALGLAVLAIFLLDRRTARPIMSMRLGEEDAA